MKKRVIKIAALVVLFAAVLVISNVILNRGNDDQVVDMGDATLPRVSFMMGGQKINALSGYVDDMDIAAMRDTITPLESDGTLKMQIEKNDNQIREISYSVYSLDGTETYDKGTLKSAESEDVTLKLGKSLGDKIQEAVLQVSLVIGEEKETRKVNFYTRIEKADDITASQCLTFAQDFHCLLYTSAKILNPEKTVLMPDMAADCPMAHMASAETIEKIRSEYDDLAVVCYINSTAELKRHSDVCVTSSNAVKIVKALPNKNIFFIPDRNLAHYIAGLVPEKNFIYNEGFCIVHEYMEVEEIQEAKAAHPEAEVLSHPECPAKVLELSDFVGSTSEIIAQAGKSDAKEFIICTESGVLYELQKRNPEKKFYFTETTPICRNMKKVTLEKVLHVLKTGENEVFVDDKLREESKKPLERMLELAK